ncbi:MAG: Cof-type HAD-IIB family hydrolase [Angelakisella sp.]
MEVKLVVCDMDGTLLNSQKEISPRSLAAIQLARDNDIYVTICSGRIFSMLECYWQQLGIHGPIIASNGAQIFDTVSGKTVWGAPMKNRQAIDLMAFCALHNLDGMALCEDGCYFFHSSGRLERFTNYNSIAARSGYKPIPITFLHGVQDCELLADKIIYKVLVSRLHDGDEQLVIDQFLCDQPELDYTMSDVGLLDISAKGINKGTGLVHLAEQMGIPLENCCAIGDFDNDLSMIEVAGLGVAMGNGCDRVKAIAQLITDTNDNDGVAKVLEQLCRKDEVSYEV